MLEILIGFTSGVISGMGMGGGTILILLLTFLQNMNQHVAQATNLVFFIPTAIAATLVGIKNKNIEIKFAMPIIIFGVIGAGIGASIAKRLEVSILKKCFGTFLLIICLYEIYFLYKRYRKEKNNHTKEKKEEEK